MKWPVPALSAAAIFFDASCRFNNSTPIKEWIAGRPIESVRLVVESAGPNSVRIYVTKSPSVIKDIVDGLENGSTRSLDTASHYDKPDQLRFWTKGDTEWNYPVDVKVTSPSADYGDEFAKGIEQLMRP